MHIKIVPTLRDHRGPDDPGPCGTGSSRSRGLRGTVPTRRQAAAGGEFDDCHQLWLAGGFHRLDAAKLAGLTEIEVDVDEGGRDDAILYAVGDNATHGVRRTAEDKRRAVGILLARPEWAKWSDREIAERCRVSHKLVAKVRRILTGAGTSEGEGPGERTYITKHGTEAVMNTSNIGKGRAPVSAGKPNKEAARVDGIGLPIPLGACQDVRALDRFDQAIAIGRSIAQQLNRVATVKGGEVFTLSPQANDLRRRHGVPLHGPGEQPSTIAGVRPLRGDLSGLSQQPPRPQGQRV